MKKTKRRIEPLYSTAKWRNRRSRHSQRRVVARKPVSRIQFLRVNRALLGFKDSSATGTDWITWGLWNRIAGMMVGKSVLDNAALCATPEEVLYQRDSLREMVMVMISKPGGGRARVFFFFFCRLHSFTGRKGEFGDAGDQTPATWHDIPRQGHLLTGHPGLQEWVDRLLALPGIRYIRGREINSQH